MENQIKFLIVDDDMTDRMSVARAARMSGYKVVLKECASAEAAIDELTAERYDLAFIDINLPGMTGLDLLKECIRQSLYTPCVMMTGQGDEALAVDCMKNGAFDYLPKNSINPEQINKILKNISRIVQAEKSAEEANLALATSRSFFTQIISNLPIVIFAFDSEGTLKFIDGKVSELLAVSGYEILNRSIYDLEGASPFSLSNYKQALEGNETEATAEINGRMIHFSYFSFSECKNDKSFIGGIITDITSEFEEQKKIQSEIQSSLDLQKLKETFLANMSHEIRTPIHGIINLSGILLGTSLNDDQRKFIDAIKKSADNLHVIINDILDLSKIQADKMAFENYPFSIRESVATLYELLYPAIEQKGLSFQYQIDDDIPELVNGDSVRFSQVINNLTGNAMKFTENGGISIRVSSLDRNENCVVIKTEIRDTGIGIPPDKLNKIFDAFTQAGDDITRKFGGTGLGLSISKKLIELQGGEIHVESTPGKGSCFSFSLPFELAPDQIPAQKAEIVHQQERDFKPFHILVVEDNDINRIVITKLLNDWNFTYDCAHDGLTAIELAERNQYDLILLDVEMPGMKGYEVSKYIRKELKKANLPIVAMTAHTSKEEERKCLASGMNDYISKPFSPDDLKIIIYSSIEKQQTYQQLHQEKTTPDTKAGSGITDLTYLNELSEGNEEFFREFITLFLQNAPETIKEVLAGIHSDDWERVRQAAHKLKPSLSYIGMKEEYDLTARIEEFAKTKTHLEQIPLMAEKISKACEQAYIELEKGLHSFNTK